jgi:hypothetical protein
MAGMQTEAAFEAKPTRAAMEPLIGAGGDRGEANGGDADQGDGVGGDRGEADRDDTNRSEANCGGSCPTAPITVPILRYCFRAIFGPLTWRFSPAKGILFVRT